MPTNPPRAAVLAALVLAAATLFSAAPPAAGQASSSTWRSGSLVLEVTHDPFAITVHDAGRLVLQSAPPALTEPDGRTGPLGFAVAVNLDAHQLGYAVTEQVPVRWLHATSVTEVAADGRTLTVATDDPVLGRTFTVTVDDATDGILRLDATLSDTVGVAATGASFATDPDEHFLGLGARSDGADQTGRIVTNWSEEGPFSAGFAAPATDPVFGDRWQGPRPFPGTNYPMPWFLSSRGYGFLLDSDWLSAFDLASTTVDAWHVATREPALGFDIVAGPTPAEALERFTADVGRQPEPVEWFFGPWVQPGPDQDYWREMDIPITVAQTYRHYLPCAAQSGDRAADVARAEAWHARGYRITTYVNSFVCNHHPDGAYEVGDGEGHFIQTPLGGTYPVPYVAYVGEDAQWHGVVDFSSAAATTFWQDLVTEAIEDGYDGWMEDFGEYVPVDAVLADGRTGLAAHNPYCTDYHRASDALTRPLRGDDFAAFVRCGWTGTAKWARLVWGADPSEDFSKADGLGAAVSQGQSMGLSGVGYWGSDIGGFHAITGSRRTDLELQSRWVEFGALSGIMRTQTNGYPRPGPSSYANERENVWDDAVRPTWRRYTKLRTQLFPEIWRAAQQYQLTGMPIMRHLALVAPDDPEVHAPGAEYEYLFGDNLLVAPVIEDGQRERTVYLPEGDWIDFWQAVAYDEPTGDFARNGSPLVTIPGRQYVTVPAPLDVLPMFVRARTCLELLPADTDTIADTGAGGRTQDLPDVVQLPEALARMELLDFGGCGARAGEPQPASRPLPATGAGLAGAGLMALAATVRSRRSRPPAAA